MLGASDKNKYLEFEDLIYTLLVKLGYQEIKKNHKYCDHQNRMRDIDVLMGESGNKEFPLTVVEVKYYRPFSKPSRKVIEHAIIQLEENARHLDATHSLLIISCPFRNYDPTLKEIENPNLEIWDLDILIEKAKSFPEILENLNSLLELDKKALSIDINHISTKRKLKGEALLEEYETISPGRSDAYRFESWCIDVLKYLFGEYLTGWHEQSTTIDGLNIRDLVCRVIHKSNSEIWELILNTLRSRYVIFEFKNYTKEITQREIITTERYLYPTALRSCAFILSRKGMSKNANSVMEGAMREHGKLMISLDCKDISTMLKGKDNGDDPNVYLFDKVDQFLIGLSR